MTSTGSTMKARILPQVSAMMITIGTASDSDRIRATAVQVIERREFAGQGIRLVVGRGRGGDPASARVTSQGNTPRPLAVGDRRGGARSSMLPGMQFTDTRRGRCRS